jgi:hypothetical protein
MGYGGDWQKIMNSKGRSNPNPIANAFFSAALLQQALGGREDARNLVRLFSSEEAFDKTIQDIMESLRPNRS